MEAMFLDAVGGASPRSPFAAQAKALLVESDLVRAAVFGSTELEGGRDSGATSADDGDADWAVRRQRQPPE
jgi:hypothetical protein